MKDINKNVIVYLTDNREKNKAIKKYWTDKDKQNYGRLKNEKSE